MPKRVTIYVDNLSEYIDTVRESLYENSQRVQEYANNLVPPYPVTTLDEAVDIFHSADLALVIESCFKQFIKSLETQNDSEIQRCIDIYVNLPSRNSGIAGNSQPGVGNTTFDDEMLASSDKIADYLIGNGFKVPYIKHQGVTSNKVIASLAVIYTGRMLKKKQVKKESDEPAT